MSQHQQQQRPSTQLISQHKSANDKTSCLESDRNWFLHRNREQPIHDPNEPPINQIKFYLDRYKIKEALQIFFDEGTLRLLRVDSDFMWDLIPLICKRLRGLCQYRFRVFEGCERMLCRIAVDEGCNPKEVLISLLAEISQQDNCTDDNVFRAMMRPLEGTLLRMNYPSPRDENLRWVLNVLVQHINNLELPQEYNLDGRKRLALPSDPNMKRFSEVLPLVLNFIEEFNDRPVDFDKSPMPILTESQIDEVFNGELVDDDLINEYNPIRADSLDASVSVLLGLMSRPLSFLDLTSYCTDLRVLANRCLGALLKLHPNLFSPIYKRICEKPSSIDYDSFNSNSTSGGLSNESIIPLATCSYIYRCERVVSYETMLSFPQVISHQYMLICHIPFIVGLLERPETLVHEKGLLLLEGLLKILEHDSLGQKFLDLFETSSLHQQLFKIIVFSPLCTNRRRAYDMFTCICDLLTHDCKLKMFRYVLTQADLRPCVRAASIDQYRKHLTNIYRELMNLYQQHSAKNHPNSEKPESSEAIDGRSLVQNSQHVSSDLNQTQIIDASSDLKKGEGNSETADDDFDEFFRRRTRLLDQRYQAIGGQVLVEFLELCIQSCLPDSQHTDIIENYELLLATLTMFRFLKLRKTIFRDEVEEKYLTGKRLKKSFFDPIRNAIALIISELKMHHKDIVDGHKRNGTRVSPSSVSTNSQSKGDIDLLTKILGPKSQETIEPIESTSATGLNEQDESECLNWTLCRLDLVESVLVRTCDLYGC